MKALHFSVSINSPKQKVWETLWNDSTYRQWTSVFSEGSYAVSDWKEGSKILFLNGNGDGMHSLIDKKIPNELMSFKHLGMVIKEVEQRPDEKSKKWEGAKEIYNLKENGGTTELTVELNTTEEAEDYFQKTFPTSLAKVKELSER